MNMNHISRIRAAFLRPRTRRTRAQQLELELVPAWQPGRGPKVQLRQSKFVKLAS